MIESNTSNEHRINIEMENALDMTFSTENEGTLVDFVMGFLMGIVLGFIVLFWVRKER